MPEAKFVCECNEAYRSACEGLEFYREVEGKKYCVLHCPVQDKVNEFNEVLHHKLCSLAHDFRGVYFPAEVSFSGVNFDSNASFMSAKFSANVDFCGATFSADADFLDTMFSADAYFILATFSADANFSMAKIEANLRFVGAEKKTVFTETETASLKLQLAQIPKPEQLLFHTVRLRAHWFVNVDCRKFEFINIDWGKTTVRDELQALEKVENRHYLLSIAYRRLATNYEENYRYDEAAEFRYASMKARLLEYKWTQASWWLNVVYWLVSGYGERIPRAAICLLVLLLGFSFLYTKVGFETKSEIVPIVQEMMPPPAPRKDMPLPTFMDGLAYAMSAALFQRPEPKAYTIWAKTCVALEMIFVPLQAALLALAIRRRFMR